MCPKCGAGMEFGIMADGHGEMRMGQSPERVLQWIRGTPERGWFTLRFNVAPKDRYQVAALRCTGCGYLELHAPGRGGKG